MRKGKILAGAGLALLSAAVLWGCQDRETISPLENGEADEVCEIAIENLTLGTKYPGHRGSRRTDQRNYSSGNFL